MNASSPSAAPDLAQLLAGTRCVIFDFDGVVADSETVSLNTLRDALAEHGFDMTLEEVRDLFLGKSLKTIEGHFAALRPGGLPGSFVDTWQSALYERLRADVAAMDGLKPLLDALDDLDRPYAIASSSSFERLGVTLDAIGLRDRFPNLFSAEQVTNGKPAPDLFLFAAKQIGVDPAHCLVIEDSPHGIRAAVAAGMHSIGFVGGSHLRGLEADHEAILRSAGAADVVARHAALQQAMPSARPQP